MDIDMDIEMDMDGHGHRRGNILEDHKSLINQFCRAQRGETFGVGDDRELYSRAMMLYTKGLTGDFLEQCFYGGVKTLEHQVKGGVKTLQHLPGSSVTTTVVTLL